MTYEPVKKKVVPWYSKSEWNDVFEKAFSGDIDLQNEAYKRMCLWKLRSPKLPVGVECTLEILQIRLFSEKQHEVQYSQKDLQLIYSTTLMRFINQLTHLYSKQLNRVFTCYDVANIYGIPDWIVNIRHEAAHDNTLPPIELLTAASNFALDWLYKNYWRLEDAEAEDFIIEDIPPASEFVERKLRIVFNLWQACKLYKLANFNTVGVIPNSLLRSDLLKLRKVLNVMNSSEPFIPDEYFSGMSSSVSLDDYLTCDASSENSSIKIGDILKYLRLYLFHSLCKPVVDVALKSVFIKTLIQCELFLPVLNSHECYVNESEINGLLSCIWKEILVLFHQAELMTELLAELVEISLNDNISSRQMVAACWVSHLSKSISNPSSRFKVYRNSRRNFKNALSFLKNLNVETGFDSNDGDVVQNQSFLGNLNLSKCIPLNYHFIENIVNKIIRSPNHYTTIFLPCFLNLLNPPLHSSARDGIIQLVEAYTNTEDCSEETTSDVVYTADMIPGFGKLISEEIVETNCNEEILPNKSIWSKKYGEYDWSSCPFGAFPKKL